MTTPDCRETEHQRVAADAERDRLPRLHGDAPEDLLDAELSRDCPHEIVWANRDAAGADDEIRVDALLERRSMSRLVIRGGGERDDVGAARAEGGREHDAVRLVDLAGLQSLARTAQLGARAENERARTAGARHLTQPRSRERADLSRAERGSCAEHDIAGRKITAARPDVRANLDTIFDLHAVGMLDNILHRDDGIGTFRDHTARRDSHRLACLQRTRRRHARSDPTHDRQRAGCIGRANGETVHRRARERGQIHHRSRVRGEHAAGRSLNRHGLRRQTASARENRCERLLDREQARHGGRILGAVISVVVPVYNEERSVGLLYEELQAALDPLPDEWEVVYVDDGSTDDSFSALTRLHSRAGNVRVVRLRRNFGKAAALAAGFAEATGDIVVTLDGDLQDDPSEIPHLLAKLDEGFDLVSGWKTRRRDPITRRIPSKLFNWAAGRMSGVQLHDMNCGLKAYRGEVVRGLVLYGELHRFIPVLAHEQGYRIAELSVNHRPRGHGRSRYGLERYLRGFLDLLTVSFMGRYRHRPLHLFGGLGLLLTLAGTASSST